MVKYDLLKSNVMLPALIWFAFGHPQLVVAGSSLSADIFFTKREAEKVVQGNIITQAYLKYHNTISTEHHNYAISIPKTKYTEDTEYSEYEMIAVEKAFLPYSLDKKTILELYNNLTNYSKLSGIHYYSRSEARMRPFILSSFRIDTPDSKHTIKDSAYSNILPERTNYFRIEDNRFGKLIFESKVYNEENNMIIKNVCIQPMKKFAFTINNKGEYQLTYIFIYDRIAKGFFYYAFHAMRIRSDSILKLGLLRPENFANRLRAITIHMAKYFSIDWSDKNRPFEVLFP